MARALLLNWRADHRSTPVRLLGMGVTGIEECGAEDLAENRSEQKIDRVLDNINRRYGDAGVVHGQTLRKKKN
jgi:hypothetical protein